MKTETQRFNENAEIIKESIRNARTEKALIVCLILTDTLHESPAFEAKIRLRSIGAANNYDGIRSAGIQLAMRWESEILNPALQIAHRMKAARN